MRYYYILGNYNNAIRGETNSRDSKRLVREFGVDAAYVVNKSGRVISSAARDVNENVYNTFFGYGEESYIGNGWEETVSAYKNGTRRYFGA